LSFRCRTRATWAVWPFFFAQSRASRWVLKVGEDVVGVVLNHVVVDRVPLGTTLRPWLNIDVRHFGLTLLLKAARRAGVRLF
jgi:hypothetical protein